MLGNRCECHGSSEMTIINGCPVSQWVWHDKEPTLLNGHDCRAKVKIWSSSLSMVTYPYDWKIFKWDDKPQTNKHGFEHLNTPPPPKKNLAGMKAPVVPALAPFDSFTPMKWQATRWPLVTLHTIIDFSRWVMGSMGRTAYLSNLAISQRLGWKKKNNPTLKKNDCNILKFGWN